MIVHIQYCVDGTGDVIKIQLSCKKNARIKNVLMPICNSWSVFWEGGTKFVLSETRLHIVDFS